MGFQSKIDCELAIMGLKDLNCKSYRELVALDEGVLRRAATQYLRW